MLKSIEPVSNSSSSGNSSSIESSFNCKNCQTSTPLFGSASINYEDLIDFRQFSSNECSLILNVIGKDSKLKFCEQERLE
jgi:hypothetical protein